MGSKDFIISIFIILVFTILSMGSVLTGGIEQVKREWPKYKCHPAVMPFANVFGHDTGDNFTACIRTLQSDYMGHLMQPIQYQLSMVSSLTGQLTGSLDVMRGGLSGITGSFGKTMGGVLQMFDGIKIEFVRFSTTLKDTLGKLSGTIITVLHATKGTVYTIKSAWNGGPGKAVRRLCFSPDTMVRLEDGSYRRFDQIKLGDVFDWTGSVVEATVELRNIGVDGLPIETMYRCDGTDGQTTDILVSGSHLMYNPLTEEFATVESMEPTRADIHKTDETCETLHCLITSNNTIPIGPYIFHDWND